MSINSGNFAEVIKNALKNRDIQQKNAFPILFTDYGKLRDSFVKLTNDVNKLENDNRKLKQENVEQATRLEKSNALKSFDNDKKVILLQEEVTESLRKQNSLANKVIEVSKTLQEKNDFLQELSQKVEDLESTVRSLNADNISLKKKCAQLEHAKKVVDDELSASKSNMTNLDNSLRQTREEKDELVNRLQDLQKTLEELRNIEHDVKYRRHQEVIRQQLQEASSMDVGMSEPFPVGKLTLPLTIIPQKSMEKLNANEGEVNSVRFSPSGKIFGSGGYDRKMRLWKVVGTKCELSSTLVGCNAPITSIDFDPNERTVLGASSDFSCRIWTLSDSRLRFSLTGHTDRVISAKFIGTTNQVVTASSDSTTKIWNVERCCCIHTLMAPSRPLDVLSCFDRRAIITGHYDHRIRLWDERSGKLASHIAVSDRVTGLDLSPDFNHVLVCTKNDSLEVVSLNMNAVVKTFTDPAFHTGLDTVRPCFSPCMQYVAAGGKDGGLYIWDVNTGCLESCLREHKGPVVCCHWNPDGHSIVSCERLSTVIIWSDF